MKYGRTREGERWHRLRDDGLPLCFDRAMVFVDVRDVALVNPSDVCLNCDSAMRVAGKEARERAVLAKKLAKQPDDVYEPRRTAT